MPNSPSAKKRLRTSLISRDKNRAVKSSLRTMIRKLRETVAAGNLDGASAMLPTISKKLDQAASKKVIHFNKAARLKSRLNKYVKSKKAAA